MVGSDYLAVWWEWGRNVLFPTQKSMRVKNEMVFMPGMRTEAFPDRGRSCHNRDVF